MEQTTRIYFNIPVGILNDIISLISMVAEISNILIRDCTNSDNIYDNNSIWKEYNGKIPENFTEIDLSIEYSIDHTLTYSFGEFLNEYITKICNKVMELNLNLELLTDD